MMGETLTMTFKTAPRGGPVTPQDFVTLDLVKGKSTASDGGGKPGNQSGPPKPAPGKKPPKPPKKKHYYLRGKAVLSIHTFIFFWPRFPHTQYGMALMATGSPLAALTGR